ncbi:PAS domain-containing protein [uncultured Campylobacter sp.]|uniref:PAS domain-containing protein n=1 Tax=uncultured Campylobacter sp. TaxID=218934 RepID=UPI00262FCB4A|nr:PAS domain-containing protein [uncultured Campylobacter sp.]
MQEIKLRDDTLITSKTNLKGDISYANHDFLKYAGYDHIKDVLNKPHNIVRHKDMPKTVFKYLWEYMKNGDEIFAFVKNLAKNGDFYWVFANVTPSKDANGNVIGYYSVRRRPNEKALAIIKELYAKLLELEQKEGVNKACEMLDEYCKGQGKTYNELIFSLQSM